MLLNKDFNFLDLLPTVAKILGQLNFWLQLKLRFSISGYDMHVDSRFLAGEEKEPIPAFTEYCRTHLSLQHITIKLSGAL